jgi:hypothetical protein
MRILRAFCVISVVAAASFQMNAQSFNAVNVHIPYPITAGSKQLSPGDYTIRPLSGSPNTFVILKDGRRAETIVRAVPVIGNPNTAESTDIVLHGNEEGYVLDKMWVAGFGGYEFMGNRSERSREAERQVAVIPARTVSASE